MRSLPSPADDFEAWRDRARDLLRAGTPPDHATWDAAAGDLFALPVPEQGGAAVDTHQPRVARAFMQVAQSVFLHSDPERFSLLYRLLWRLQGQPRLMEDQADPDVRRAERLAQQVRRDIHKMRAFLRFRAVEEPDGSERYVAWFEPDHHILRANAGFFVRRFTTMRWSILTPLGSLHWDGETLQEGPPAQAADAPAGDPTEDLWRGYYASIFNPARLKVGAMLKEMPRRYWKNMPEAALIPQLIATAQAREARMVAQGSPEMGERPDTLREIAELVQACRRCPIGCNGTQAVAGEGPDRAGLMIVGEQPGDVEEQAGRPFVGPAGQVLRTHLDEAGIDLPRAYLTNAVKHFKFTPTGKRRLHQSPTAGEIDTCRWWLEGERVLVRPRVILALGASAARGLLGRTVSVQKERGRPHVLEDGAELWITTHPSYLLRLTDEARATEERRFAEDLRAVAGRVRVQAA
ncbi:UdgX family uracil-DNA binding protein [Novosphingobium sp.]|uniref:UdgX family uracil-DNA binding protein n=1 Tax=Novosphingobium sp. TaxID=1874826 RepID=UPI0038B86A71|nr:UdgX family uracil-DNA binding protein [Pseudomonadota bacterium]